MRKTCLEQLYLQARKNKKIVFIGSDIGAGVMKEFQKEMPDRFFMEGISEQHIVGMAAGMAMEGKIVYINTIATFLTRRCFEQNMLDVGLHRLKVRLIGSGGGLVYAPLGPTHLALNDIAIMRSIPNMAVCVPSDAIEMIKLMKDSVEYPGPIYIRLAKGGDPLIFPKNHEYEIGMAYLLKKGRDALVITTGVTLQIAIEAAKKLRENGINIAVLHVPSIKPLDTKKIIECISKVPLVVTIEEHSEIGGLGSTIAEIISEGNFKPCKKFKRIALPDVFPEDYGSQVSLMKKYGISTQNLMKVITSFIIT